MRRTRRQRLPPALEFPDRYIHSFIIYHKHAVGFDLLKHFKNQTSVLNISLLRNLGTLHRGCQTGSTAGSAGPTKLGPRTVLP